MDVRAEALVEAPLKELTLCAGDRTAALGCTLERAGVASPMTRAALRCTTAARVRS